jgi:hypothetical protein
MRNFLLSLYFLLSFTCSIAQDSTFSYRISGTGALTTQQTPFWLHSNQFGQVPVNGPFVLMNSAIYKSYSTTKQIIDWKVGVNLITVLGPKSDLFLTDAHLATKLGKIEVLVGQEKGSIGLVDSTLSSGSIAWSGNNRPFPKIQISIPTYYSFGFTKHFIAVKGTYSDGLLGNAPVQYGNVNEIPNVYLHQKSFDIRLGRPEQRLHLFGGFNHQVMWGGEEQIFTGGLKPSLAYKYAVFGKSWAGSRVGNHFGTIDIGGEWRGDKWTLFGYRQNIYEDGSLSQLTNVADGLNGLSLTRNKIDKSFNLRITKVLLEFLSTKSQGGSIFDFQNGVFGRDNYFNHYVYTQGWSYRRRSLGTPILSNQSLFKGSIPRSESNFTTNNRLWAVHFGIISQIGDIKIITKGTYSRNFGTYDRPFTPTINQFAFLLKGEKHLSKEKRTFLSAQFTLDAGGLYPSNVGLDVTWRKEGYFSRNKK